MERLLPRQGLCEHDATCRICSLSGLVSASRLAVPRITRNRIRTNYAAFYTRKLKRIFQATASALFFPETVPSRSSGIDIPHAANVSARLASPQTTAL
jgi:hypothetical protein